MKVDTRILLSNISCEYIRCPHCGQVLCALDDVYGSMRVVVKCRRCKSFIGIHVCSE